jgi:hypothetical protein
MKWVALSEKAPAASCCLQQDAMTKGIRGFIRDAVLRNKDLKSRPEALDKFFPGRFFDDFVSGEIERFRVLAVQ